jgi:uncharacterized protein with PIN domain
MMARLYGDENFDALAMMHLRELGHDTLSAKEAGQINQRVPDEDVLRFATSDDRAVVTFDRRDYYHLHQQNPTHGGIIACTYNPDSSALAEQIDEQITKEAGDLTGKYIRVYRPHA